MPAQPRLFYLIGYLTPDGDYVQSFNDKATDFGKIYYDATPPDTRWVIVRADDEVWVVDLNYAMQAPNINNPIGVDLYVGEYIAFPEKNAAIMAALMLRS